ncbi:antitoxin VbhA family protein [Corynebacterium camporealensis]
MTTSTFNSATQEKRKRQVAEAIHSIEMEKLTVPAESKADAEDYIAGKINADDLIERVRARYGLD